MPDRMVFQAEITLVAPLYLRVSYYFHPMAALACLRDLIVNVACTSLADSSTMSCRWLISGDLSFMKCNM